MRRLVRSVLASLTWVSAGLLASTAAHAVAQAPLYDDFSAAGLDSARWVEPMSWRYVDGAGRLSLGRYTFGDTSSDYGVFGDSFSSLATDKAPAKSLRAQIRVLKLDVGQGCPTNGYQSYSLARVRLFGALFNIQPGGPVSGDRRGDVLALVRIGRASNSVDPTDVMRVQGLLSQCLTSDCSQLSAIGTVQELGPVSVGTQVKAQIFWNKTAKTVTFVRDAMAPAVLSYTQNDDTPPAWPVNGWAFATMCPLA